MILEARRLLQPALCVLAACWTSAAGHGQDAAPTSQAIAAVLRTPLAPEELKLSEEATELVIAGPTFTYRVSKASGVIAAVRVIRDDKTVIESTGPSEVQIDQGRLASAKDVQVTTTYRGKDKVVVTASGVLRDPEQRRPDIDFGLISTFFNDGVVITEVTLTPHADLSVETAILHRLPLQGKWHMFDHKRRDHQGPCVRGALPDAAKTVRFDGPSSCLQVYGPDAGAAIFTDCGATHLSQPKLESASVEVVGKKDGFSQVVLSQFLVHIAKGDKPYLLKAGQEFRYRLGISVVPNKLPHPRSRDLRMFTWIGDAKNPYPTDAEIDTVARMGFTLFQLHRAGTPGDPRPPAGEAARVVKKVHDAGMLFLWEENPDLLYASAPGVVKLKTQGKWAKWQGFNYGGRYTDWMDPYCDLIATCLAAPNGLAEYRLANIHRMMDQMPVDGLYLDDNAAYPTCSLWKEHGHPRPVYDCLIEHHEMNWRRRELMRSRCPHLVLVSHCSKHGLLPLICDFDAQIFGEGYTFNSLQDYWNEYSSLVKSVPSQGMIWPSAAQPNRCGVSMAYNFDLMTGGGQYTQIDWRVFFKKYPAKYTKGADDRELGITRFYNLAQYYFGMYESKSYCFAYNANRFTATTPQTYAAVYHNRVWNDWLIPLANMNGKPLDTTLAIRSPESLGLESGRQYVVFDVQRRSASVVAGKRLSARFEKIRVPGENLRLFYLRTLPGDAPYHLWGGKRIAETWDDRTHRLTVKLLGPAGLQETVILSGAKYGIEGVRVAGSPAKFYFDPARNLVHGQVTFTSDPLLLEVTCAPEGRNSLPEAPIPSSPFPMEMP
jgi:hypothetical protein